MGYFMENPFKMDDLGVPLFQEAPKWTSIDFMSQKVGIEYIRNRNEDFGPPKKCWLQQQMADLTESHKKWCWKHVPVITASLHCFEGSHSVSVCMHIKSNLVASSPFTIPLQPHIILGRKGDYLNSLHVNPNRIQLTFDGFASSCWWPLHLIGTGWNWWIKQWN